MSLSLLLPDAVESRVAGAGVELAVVEAGDRAGPTVLLVHGYPDTKELWGEVAMRLVDRFHVVAYDVRGAGASTAPSGRDGFDLQRLVDDAIAVIDATARGRKVHLVGHDWGSIQGWEFVTSPRLADRIASFTSISGPSLDHAGHWVRDGLRRPTPRRLLALAGQARRSTYIAAMRVPGFIEGLWPRFLARRWRPFLSRLEGVPPANGYPAPTLARDGALGVGLYRRNVGRRLRHPRTDVITRAPVQLVVASGERYISPRIFDDLERWAPLLRRRTVAGGHWVPRTHPELLARWIAEFAEHVENGEEDAGPGARPQPGADSDQPFAGRLVLVTGAGSGIGRATGLAFAAAGATLILADIDGDTATETARLAEQLGAKAGAVTVDVSDAAAMEELADRVGAEHGAVDVLVNNAGIAVAGPFLDTRTEDWERVLGVNLWGVIHGCRLFGRQMVERGTGGQIVNVASAAAFQPSKGLPAYSTSKAAVLMLSECLRAELGAYGIGVSAVCPGLVNTNITRTTRFVGRSEADQDRMRAFASAIYRRRNFPPERVAEAVLRAASTDTAVIAVAPEAKAMRALSRLSPRALRALAKADVLPG